MGISFPKRIILCRTSWSLMSCSTDTCFSNNSALWWKVYINICCLWFMDFLTNTCHLIAGSPGMYTHMIRQRAKALSKKPKTAWGSDDIFPCPPLLHATIVKFTLPCSLLTLFMNLMFPLQLSNHDYCQPFSLGGGSQSAKTLCSCPAIYYSCAT